MTCVHGSIPGKRQAASGNRKLTSGDQALNDAVVLAANFGSAEKPVVAVMHK
jgi:hypothetical protein